MVLAGIDIGSNAVRLLIAGVGEQDGVVTKYNLIRVPVRLGEDVFRYGAVSEEKTENLVSTLQAFRLLLDIYRPRRCLACATAAMREAANKKAVLERLRQEAGIDVVIVDDIEEARILARVNNIFVPKPFKYKLYIDVGGGSTELSFVKGKTTIQSASFSIGTIRLRDNLVAESEWQRLQEWLRPLKGKSSEIYPVGSGGNINKLFKMYGKAGISVIKVRRLETAFKTLSGLSVDARISRLGLRPDRADVIVPAADIFLKCLKWSGADFIHVSRKGLVDGIIETLYDEENLRTGATLQPFINASDASFAAA